MYKGKGIYIYSELDVAFTVAEVSMEETPFDKFAKGKYTSSSSHEFYVPPKGTNVRKGTRRLTRIAC